MAKIITNKILFLSITLFLSSCSVYKGSFDCKAHKGIGCESVSKVNELVDDNKLDEFIETRSNKKKSKKCPCQNSASEKQADTKVGDKNEAEKITIYFNEYKEKGVTYKESEIEVGAK